jgi:hypothetical protein
MEPGPWNLDGSCTGHRRDESRREITQAPIDHRIRADDLISSARPSAMHRRSYSALTFLRIVIPLYPIL